MSDKNYKEAVAAVDKLMPDHPEMIEALITAKFEALVRFDPGAANEYAKTVCAAGDAKAESLRC